MGVEQGIDLETLIAQPGIVIFRSAFSREIQDFLTAWLLTFAFEDREFREDKFNLPALLYVLDEQRRVLMSRR